MHRIKQANLVGPAGLISMEDTLATELVQFATANSGDALSIADWAATRRTISRSGPALRKVAYAVSGADIRS